MSVDSVATLHDQVSRLAPLVRLMRRRALTEMQLPATALGALRAIDQTGPHGGHRSKDLAARFGVDSSTFSRTLRPLLGNGLVERRLDPLDGRTFGLVTTPAGREVVNRIEAWGAQVFGETLRSWTETETTEFTRLFERFLAGLETQLAPPSPAEEASAR
ncbi:MarR family winged helix-turn-helix transcriptional regulator [Cryptosporangium minutisporangium]|uniref:HTH marR-type domain-containing protein n=1 Tax=Cryptosporangium minutisporangium TaxID=113569 RepID=A0ABP6SXL1_9ACTN